MALVALITFGFVVLAIGTCTQNVAISKESIAFLAIALIHLILEDATVISCLIEDLLNYLGMPRSACSSKVVEVNVKPLVDAVVDLKVVVADLLRSLSFFECLNLSCCTIFVCAADVQNIVSVEPLVSCEDIS